MNDSAARPAALRLRPRTAGGALSRPFAVAVLVAAVCARLPADTQPASGGSELDQLFNDGTSTGSPEASTSSAPAADAQARGGAVRADDLTRDDRIHIFGSIEMYGDLGVGWADLPDPAAPGQDLGAEGGGSLTASVGFDVRPTPELRLRSKMSYNFPTTGFQISEMIVDYTILNAVFVRLGIFDYTWGNSQFYQFGNLPARSLPDWSISNQPLWERTNLIVNPSLANLPVSAKVSIPFGVDQLSLIARFDIADYGFPDQTRPDPKYAGYGLQYDLVTGPIEWSIAGFWQRLLTPRSLLAMKTTILGFDLSAESIVAYPVKFTSDWLAPIPTTGGGIPVEAGPLERIYPSAVVGLSRSLPNANIRLHAEYAYNGERKPGTSWLEDETGPAGHSSALVLRFLHLGPGGLSFNLLWQQDWSDASALISPFLEFSPLPLTTVQIGFPVVFGPDDSEVSNNRLVPGSKAAELLLLVKVSDNFRQ